MTSLVISIFFKVMRKMAKICFFSKINLVKAIKRVLQKLFSAFKSQDNMQIEYMSVNMLVVLKNPIKRC